MKTRKALFLITFIFLYSSLLFSQEALKQGVYNLSGSISYSNSKNSYTDGTSKQFNFSISPELNYFVIDNLLVGANIGFQYSENEYSSDSFNFTFINRQIGIGPNIRYYFSGLNVSPFVGVSASYFKEIGYELEGNNFTFMTGINVFLSNSAALEPFIAYSISSLNSDNNQNSFVIGVRMSYFILN